MMLFREAAQFLDEMAVHSENIPDNQYRYEIDAQAMRQMYRSIQIVEIIVEKAGTDRTDGPDSKVD